MKPKTLFTLYQESAELNNKSDQTTYQYPLPKSTTNKDMYDFLLLLKTDEDSNSNERYKEYVFVVSLQQLIKKDSSGTYVIKLWNHPLMNWDSMHSIIFSDLIVKEGDRMIPILKKCKDREVHKTKLIKTIERGIKHYW